MNGFPQNFSSPGGFPAFPNFGNHAVQVPNGWAPNPMATNGDDMHQPGPMRRGGGRFNNPRQGGPYDRRQPRYGGNGRLTPPRNGIPTSGGTRGGAGKWGDGAGAQTVGPVQATQGRALKSYEDLDAVSSGAGGELNY